MTTLANVLHQPQLHLIPLWCPHADIIVRWGAVSDLDNPTPFLEGGELLMTTNAGNPTSATAWDRYVRRVKEAGIAALAFAVGEWKKEVPHDLISAAHKHDINLIEVPERERFVHISQVLAAMLEEESSAASRQLQRAQRSLIAATSKLEPTAALLHTLATILNGAMMLYAGDSLIYSAGLNSGSDIPKALMTQLKKRYPRDERSWSIIEPEYAAVGINVGSGEVLVAYATSLAPWQRSALSDGAILLESMRALENQQRENRRNLYAHAFERLDDGDAYSCQAILSVIDNTYTVPARVSAIHAIGDHRALVALSEELVRRLRTPLAQKISPIAAPASPTPHTAKPYTAELYSTEPYSTEQPTAASHSTHSLDAVIPTQSIPLATAVVQESGVLAGCGASVSSNRAHTAIMTARIASEKAGSDRPVVSWSEISGEGLIPLLDNDRLSAWARAFLTPLERHPELMTVLAVFLSTNGNRGAMARILGVHRNTVTTRIAHIERLLQRNLDDPASRVEAWVALHSRNGFAESLEGLAHNKS
ncbi:MAG: PucR family transcriptional regulator [Actinomycetaceae bacterium]|nr:PucR family transcriptional regulator [Arcanobacterium sp.]MDD7687392.1 PucR family transcriptional regulator [Actinomycetaceae bacterium]MDY5272867.1 PucR family transcriptional regulator [Arcanobacterium sp.]